VLAVENVCRLPVPPEFVWPLYTDPAAWPDWSADIESAAADNPHEPLSVGTTGTCKYRTLPAGRFRVVTFDRFSSFILDWTTLATRVRFEHELRPIRGHGTRVREVISFHGLLAPLLGLLERPRIRTDWPRSMDCLVPLALESYEADKRGVSELAVVASRRPSRPIPAPAGMSRTHPS